MSEPISPGQPPDAGQQPSAGQPSFGPPTPSGPGGPLTPSEERNWAVGAHLSSFAAAYVALGFIGPLIVMLAVGQRSAAVRQHAVEALNFNLSILLYAAITFPFLFVLIGIPVMIGIGVLYLVGVIAGAMAANRGEQYRYPLTIRFIS